MEHIKYGDCVIFEHSKYNRDIMKIGFIGATGFINKGVNLYQQKDYLSIPESKNQKPINLRDVVFKITPKLCFEHHADYKKIHNKYIVLLNNRTHTDGAYETVDFYEKKLKKLAKKMEDEIAHNNRLIDSSHGKPLLYGSEIQLMHYESEA